MKRKKLMEMKIETIIKRKAAIMRKMETMMRKIETMMRKMETIMKKIETMMRKMETIRNKMETMMNNPSKKITLTMPIMKISPTIPTNQHNNKSLKAAATKISKSDINHFTLFNINFYFSI
jgi:hypothetical protein